MSAASPPAPSSENFFTTAIGTARNLWRCCTRSNAPTAAERDPGVGAGRAAEEPLGSEGVGVRVDVRVVLDQECARQQQDAGRVLEPPDLHRAFAEPWLGVR